jgi:ankyrin repeat protein
MEELTCVDQLLEAGANPNSTDDDGWTPLLWAVANGYAYIFEDAELE